MALILDGTNGITYPSWTTGTRPATPGTGDTGFNSTLNCLETYNGNSWSSASAVASGSISQNAQVVLASYTMPSNYSGTSAGPISLSNGVTVTLSNSSRWVIV